MGQTSSISCKTDLYCLERLFDFYFILIGWENIRQSKTLEHTTPYAVIFHIFL